MAKVNPKVKAKTQSKLPNRPLLKSYAQMPYVVGGVVITATVIVGGIFGYQHLNRRANVSKNTTNTTSAPAIVTPTPLTKYNGEYKGSTSAKYGLAGVTVNVDGAVLTGRGTYNGNVAGFDITAPVTIEGTVSEMGVVSAQIKGSGSVANQTFNVGGQANGSISGNSMSCNYSVAAAGETIPGLITLLR